MPSELDLIQQRLETLEQDNTYLLARLETAETVTRRERRRMRMQSVLALAAVMGAVLVSPANRTAIAQGYGVTLQSLATRLTAVETKNVQQDTTLASQQTQITAAQTTLNAMKSRAVIIYPDGTHPFNSNVTVTHTAVGQYHIVFAAGTFNSFGVPVLTPFGATGSISGLSSPGDGSTTLDVSLSADTYFDLDVLSIN